MFLHIKGDTQAWASGYGLKINYSNFPHRFGVLNLEK